MEKTLKNLMEAFAGESQANRKYLAFAKKAEEEGYPGIAKLFKAAADAETVHAINHLRAAGGIKSTKENLETAIKGETYEFESMYPPMLKDAEAEGQAQAQRSFYFANEVEKIHAELFKKALENIDKKLDTDYYVCQVCGHTVEGEPPEKCPVCGSPKKMYKKIE
ncbi:rubrerythrin family protein [Thermodesulfovibrio sp.]|jgi:rubrerythrin|uniref:rubrerythrin family protein n=1 Tax=Thermodesulfovibrio TaxID=28261 RepID=UPI00261B7732|nr:rubrerythrin family protein [Thermodesulfovibrio sp.]